MENFDVVIVGGGPAGSTAALYASRAELSTLVLDRAISSGALGITEKIANYPGIPEVISGADLVLRMRRQAELYGARFRTSRVVSITAGDPKVVTLADGDQVSGRALVLATGAMGRSKSLDGEEAFLGRGVSYCATCDGAFYKGKDVAVIGHAEEAVREAIFLTRFVRWLHIVSPKPALTAPPELLKELLSKPQVVTHLGRRATRVGGNGSVGHLQLDTEERLDVQGVFLFTQGNKPVVDYLLGEVETSGTGCIVVNRQMETPASGVFACGDVLCNEVQQAVVAAAQGCIAALSADRFLRKRATFAKDFG